jgi:hypothetical protein
MRRKHVKTSVTVVEKCPDIPVAVVQYTVAVVQYTVVVVQYTVTVAFFK